MWGVPDDKPSKISLSGRNRLFPTLFPLIPMENSPEESPLLIGVPFNKNPVVCPRMQLTLRDQIEKHFLVLTGLAPLPFILSPQVFASLRDPPLAPGPVPTATQSLPQL